MFRLCSSSNNQRRCRRGVESSMVSSPVVSTKAVSSQNPRRNKTGGANGRHLTRQGISDLWILIGYPQPSFQDKIRVIWRLKDSWTKICICWNMCFFCNFTLASHLQRHQFCGSGQWSVLRFVALHVAEMECLHESSRRGQVGFFNCSI